MTSYTKTSSFGYIFMLHTAYPNIFVCRKIAHVRELVLHRNVFIKKLVKLDMCFNKFLMNQNHRNICFRHYIAV